MWSSGGTATVGPLGCFEEPPWSLIWGLGREAYSSRDSSEGSPPSCLRSRPIGGRSSRSSAATERLLNLLTTGKGELGKRFVASSLREPSVFVFVRGGVLLRQVNGSYESDYRLLMDSGLHEDLSSRETSSLTKSCLIGTVSPLQPTSSSARSAPHSSLNPMTGAPVNSKTPH